ncbi:MAG TPA: glutaminyl-peptide cyclotransferase [Pseudomonadales bacterium]|nr:glutaminyl-peptide cyclotransferase [Pseudomonadales bacterium]
MCNLTFAEAPVVYPSHDTTRPFPKTCYTQGLSLDEHTIWLSCGRYRFSKIYQLRDSDWKVETYASLPAEWFAEGIAVHGQDVILLTWKNELVARIDKLNLRSISTQPFPGEAWGLTKAPNGDLVVSDGSAIIRWLNPESLEEKRQLMVTDGHRNVSNLNELEWVGDKLWANVWQSDKIAIIDPSDGSVDTWLDLASISQGEHAGGGEVLNGILYVPKENAVYITGKWWRHAYRLPLNQF